MSSLIDPAAPPATNTVPTCSVVLATMQGLTPEKATRLRLLDQQVADLGGELLVGSGVAHTGPRDRSDWRATIWFEVPGAGTFVLRRLALEHSRGAVVVISEDHCDHPDGWLATLLASHRAHPDADVIVARVDNGTDETAIDRASFWINAGHLRRPMNPRRAARQIPITGASFKRAALERLLSAHPTLPPELILPEDLRRHGLRIVVDASFGITHVQTATWARHGSGHFHNARAGAGVTRLRRARTWVRLGTSPVFTLARWARALRDARQRGHPLSEILSVAPALAWLYCAKAAGEWVGALSGPGDSATRLE